MEPSGRQSDSAEGDVAEISLLAGDSFSEDATQQVGRGIGEERIRPVRRSKTAALSAMAIAGLGGTRGSVGLAGVPGNKVGLQAVASSGPGGAVSAGRSSSVSCVGGASVTAFLPGATSAAPVALEMSGRVAEDAAAASSAHIGSEGGLGSLRDGVAAPMHRGMGVLDSCGSPHVFGVGRGMDCFSQGSVPVGGASTSWAGVFPGSWGPGWGSPSWGPGSSVSGVGPSVSQWGGSSVGPMAMGILPSCSYGTGWGVPLGMGGSILPGPASLFSWSPQMPAFLPGGRESGVSDVGAARAPERPGGSGSERSSAFGGEVAAGGGATGSSHLSSSLPGVAVRGVSASGPVSSSGNAVRGISSGGVVDQGSSSQVSPVGPGCAGGRFADASSFMEPGQEGIWELLRLSVADSTWSHYSVGFRLVATFLAERGWCPGDVAESLLADFVLSSFRVHTSRGVVPVGVLTPCGSLVTPLYTGHRREQLSVLVVAIWD
uniref:Elastin-like isoform X2 n=1 Tax=Geotrypetes seraphini TaxID=260995 RepID=A0A6P8QLT7_GEOSA|nr:elastin-like isoform X2 [Geotrypetes seraphini]